MQHAVKEEKAALHEAERKARAAGVEVEENVDDEDHKSGRVGINLGQRAHPLINLMEWTLKAVSYTHLDVYKRQVLINGLRDDQQQGQQRHQHAAAAVSYTHLDVYKRQAHNWALCMVAGSTHRASRR